MNKICVNVAGALRSARSGFAALAVVAALGIGCAASARAQAPAPGQNPHGHMGPMGQAGQMGMHPPATPPVPASTKVETPKTTPSGEQFFIVASIDQAKSEILMKRPDEVTLLLNTTPKTRYFDQNGKPLKLSDLRAGDTVWATSTGGAHPDALTIRKGQMTIAELHRYYLDYPEIK
ncbi:MAG TPA: hypothetical protein VMD77_05845 [Candidatus Baltobacteraceae bacterium]|jgi:hypothetical protein|nr:hypothetical protein [Candidatus Baltobacteraceae bacterium]